MKVCTMKELLLIRDNLANKISYYHVLLFMVSLPFDRFYSHLILASFAIHTIIQFDKKNVKPVFTWRTAALQSVFWVTAISTIYTINAAQAFAEWGRELPVLLFPLVLCFNPLDLKKYRSRLLLGFALCCTGTILYLYGDALVTIRHYKLPLSEIQSEAFTNQNFSEPIDMHATFFSLQIALALVSLLSVLIGEKLSLAGKISYGFCCLILTAGVIELGSKSTFVALLIIINIVFPYTLLPGSQRKRSMLITALLSCMILLGIVSSRALKYRYLVVLKEDMSHGYKGQNVEPRLERWKVAIGLIGRSPIRGYGAGSEVQLLQQQYFAKKYYSSYIHRLNAHNEYMSFMIKSGIWGLAVYLATLLYGFKKAIRKRDIIFFCFMILVALVSMSENLLDADKGAIFYAFFYSFFVFSSEQHEPINIPLKRHKFFRKVATKQAVTSSLS
jgi:O-antigen ligase